MYVGSTDLRGVYTLIFDLIEEFISIRNTYVSIELNEDNTILVTSNPLEVFKKNSLAITKALSDIFELKISDNLLKVKFRPDKKIFTYEHVDYYTILYRLKELAHLNENLKFFLTNNENKNTIQFCNGVKAILYEDFNWDLYSDFKLFDFNFIENNVEVYVGMKYGFSADITQSYVNNMRTYDGGTHVKGLYDGIFYAFKEYIKYNPKCNPDNVEIIKKDVIRDLNFVICVKLSNPRWGGAVKRELMNNDVRLAVKNGVSKNALAMLKANSKYENSFLHNSRAIESAVVRRIMSKN